jgi:hypothetical protein
VCVGLKLDLLLGVGGARPRPAHWHPAAPERDLAVLVAVTDRRPVRQMLALRAYDLIDLGLHQ